MVVVDVVMVVEGGSSFPRLLPLLRNFPLGEEVGLFPFPLFLFREVEPSESLSSEHAETFSHMCFGGRVDRFTN